jgi:hypothetical protein
MHLPAINTTQAKGTIPMAAAVHPIKVANQSTRALVITTRAIPRVVDLAKHYSDLRLSPLYDVMLRAVRRSSNCLFSLSSDFARPVSRRHDCKRG